MRYGIDEELQAKLDNRFMSHPPFGDQAARYAMLRDGAKSYAEFICKTVPPGRERELALTKLEEACMHANSGIARGEVDTGQEAVRTLVDGVAEMIDTVDSVRDYGSMAGLCRAYMEIPDWEVCGLPLVSEGDGDVARELQESLKSSDYLKASSITISFGSPTLEPGAPDLSRVIAEGVAKGTGRVISAGDPVVVRTWQDKLKALGWTEHGDHVWKSPSGHPIMATDIKVIVDALSHPVNYPSKSDR